MRRPQSGTMTVWSWQQQEAKEWNNDTVWRWRQHQEVTEWQGDIVWRWQQHQEATEWQGDIVPVPAEDGG